MKDQTSAGGRQSRRNAGDWISLSEASKRLGLGVEAVKTVALSGGIAVRAIPGTWPRYSASDVARLASAS